MSLNKQQKQHHSHPQVVNQKEATARTTVERLRKFYIGTTNPGRLRAGSLKLNIATWVQRLVPLSVLLEVLHSKGWQFRAPFLLHNRKESDVVLWASISNRNNTTLTRRWSTKKKQQQEPQLNGSGNSIQAPLTQPKTRYHISPILLHLRSDHQRTKVDPHESQKVAWGQA